MGKSLFISLLALCFIVLGCEKSITTEEDKVFYSVGAMFGSRLATLDLSANELDALTQGLRDAAQGKKPVVDPKDYQRKVQELFKARMNKMADAVKQKGKSYLEKFLTEKDAKKTKTGLAYKVIKQGTGKIPKATDTVEVHYHGTLIDGAVFDSSVERGKKVSFPLNRVIKGWTEGLQLIKEGGKVRLVIPPELGYGDRGAPPKIPGGSTLVFDVELFSIKPPAAAPKQGMSAKHKGMKKIKSALKKKIAPKKK